MIRARHRVHSQSIPSQPSPSPAVTCRDPLKCHIRVYRPEKDEAALIRPWPVQAAPIPGRPDPDTSDPDAHTRILGPGRSALPPQPARAHNNPVSTASSLTGLTLGMPRHCRRAAWAFPMWVRA